MKTTLASARRHLFLLSHRLNRLVSVKSSINLYTWCYIDNDLFESQDVENIGVHYQNPTSLFIFLGTLRHGSLIIYLRTIGFIRLVRC